MTLIVDHFPVFEANQVLASRHLNDDHDYLDQQIRLTRSNLVGVGIVCGLDIKLDTSAGTSILLSRGCGVTSEGYLIIEPEDVTLVSYRLYTMPSDLDYPPFHNGTGQYTLWELFPAGEPNVTMLNSPTGFLDDKAVVLFLELKKEGLRNCSPNNCDDKGAEVSATVRRLLIKMTDLDKIIAAANALGSGLTASDLDAALSAKLNLPDLHVRRFDVLNSNPVTSNDVYAGFLNVFRSIKLVTATAKALNAAYGAFQPLLQSAWPSNPFSNFDSLFGFLDTAPTTAAQVRFLQYYVDLFEDLVRAYDEFRWKGAELLCACCPSDGLFPRHLMLGLLHPEKVSSPGKYRQTFLPSPAVGCCAAESKGVLQLFTRLATMPSRFTNAPDLPKADDAARIDPQIRVTPSVLGDEPLAARAIPYYYQENGTPPLYQLWDSEKTRRNRANHNLSYRSDEYSPAAPPFVSDPLRYDLEPYNFLRIEGHLGKNYLRVVTTLLLLKSQYRLPIDIIALRTGAYDATQPVDLTNQSARFQDLEALYDALREELLSTLAEGLIGFYDETVAGSELAGGVPKLPLLKNYAPNYWYPRGSVGAFYEAHLQAFQSAPYIDVDQALVSDPSSASQEVLRVYCGLFAGMTDLPAANFPHVVSIFYISKLAEILPAALDALAYADFENKYQDLMALVRYFRSDAMAKVPADLKSFVPQQELIDDFDEVLFNCKLSAIKGVHDEYVRRVTELRKSQFLFHFQKQHPGLQHKAGVPLGGTFILVYHDEPASKLSISDTIVANAARVTEEFLKAEPTDPKAAESAAGSAPSVNVAPAGATSGTGISPAAEAVVGPNVKPLALTDALTRIASNKLLAQNPDIEFVIGSLTGKIPIFEVNPPVHGLDDRATRIIASTVNGLADGTVIADFFLPYRISSDGAGVEFVLPKPVLTFTTQAMCTNENHLASVTVTVKGGVAPYEIAIDQNAYQALGQTLGLQAGTHRLKIRDAEGTEYTATFAITGGTPPYTVTVNGKSSSFSGQTFTTERAPSGTTLSVQVVDSVNCSAKTSIQHTNPKG
jgi:hypothetical protein